MELIIMGGLIILMASDVTEKLGPVENAVLAFVVFFAAFTALAAWRGL